MTNDVPVDVDVDIDSIFDSFLENSIDKVNESINTSKVKEYDCSGRGRKQCKNCKIYVGIKTNTCNCGESFRENGKEDNQESGTGTGTSSSIHTKAEQSKIDKQVENFALDPDITDYIAGLGIHGKRLLTIYTPAFKCPFSVGQVSFESVKEFCESVIDLGINQRPAKLYLPSAIKYWLSLNCPEKKQKETLEFFERWLTEVKTNNISDNLNKE